MNKTLRTLLTAFGLLPLSFFAEATEVRPSSNVLGESRVIAELQMSRHTGGLLDALVPW